MTLGCIGGTVNHRFMNCGTASAPAGEDAVEYPHMQSAVPTWRMSDLLLCFKWCYAAHDTG